MPTEAHEQNRLSWNAATERHNLHKGDQAEFFRNGGSTLYPEDRALIGDAVGRSLLHLQCNCGQDSLSIARDLGAVVTGVDISDHAVGFAKRLSSDSGITATFIRADVFDYCEATPAPQFDVVFASYGALPWISDLGRWCRGAARALKPGGHIAIIEFHPLLGTLDEADPTRIKYSYLGGDHFVDADGVGDYVGESGDGLKLNAAAPSELPPFENPFPSNDYAWGLAEKFAALSAAGLRVDSFEEYPFSNGFKPYADMQDLPGNRKAMPEGSPALPLMYSMTATKV